MRPSILDCMTPEDICIRGVYEDCEFNPNFIIWIGIEPYSDVLANGILSKLVHLIEGSGGSVSNSKKTFMFLDKKYTEKELYIWANRISMALNLECHADVFLLVKVCRAEGEKDLNCPIYEDFATTVAPLKVGKLVDFLRWCGSERWKYGRIEIDGVDHYV